jgi:O-antigen/teichoic acid export membrane protein
MFLHLPSVVGPLVYARVADPGEQSSETVTQRAVRNTLAVTTVGCFIAAIAGFWLIPLVFGLEYLPSATLFLWLAPGIVGYGIFAILISYFQGQGYPPVTYVAPFVALTLNISLNVMLLPSMGVLAASLASTVAYWISALLLIIAFLRSTHTPIGELLFITHQDIKHLRLIAQRIWNRGAPDGRSI